MINWSWRIICGKKSRHNGTNQKNIYKPQLRYICEAVQVTCEATHKTCKHKLEPNTNEGYHCIRECTNESNKIFTITEADDIWREVKEVKSTNLWYRRLRGNMIGTYKILTGKYDRAVTQFIPNKSTIPQVFKHEAIVWSCIDREQKRTEAKYLLHLCSQMVEWITSKSIWSIYPCSFGRRLDVTLKEHEWMFR